jgi:hypothetical protein
VLNGIRDVPETSRVAGSVAWVAVLMPELHRQ